MPDRPIFFSVAHSSAAHGARAPEASNISLDEYEVSMRASLAAFRELAGDFPCQLYDCGPFTPKTYCKSKVAAADGSGARLAIEIHCNASAEHPDANYSEVIHHAASIPGREAAAVIARTIGEGFRLGQHKLWRSRGARPNTIEQDLHKDFFLENTHVPAIIVEGLFISNVDQATWLAADGAETYGLLVAEGIRRWLGGARA